MGDSMAAFSSFPPSIISTSDRFGEIVARKVKEREESVTELKCHVRKINKPVRDLLCTFCQQSEITLSFLYTGPVNGTGRPARRIVEF